MVLERVADKQNAIYYLFIKPVAKKMPLKQRHLNKKKLMEINLLPQRLRFQP